MKIILLFLLVAVSLPATAAKYTLQGNIHTLRHNVDTVDGDYIVLDGVSQAGTCPTSGGLVLVRIPDSASRAFSIALSAQVAGKQVELSVDEEMTGLGGFCGLRWLNLAN